MRKIFFLAIVLIQSISIWSADLPKSGIDPPPIIANGPDLPDDPGAPIGNGYAVLLILSGLYIIKKKKLKK